MTDSELTKTQAAVALSVQVRTIDRYIAAGKLTPIKYHNGRVRLLADEVEALAKPVNA